METTILNFGKLEDCELQLLDARDKRIVFDLGDGLYGRIVEIKHFKYVDGIDEITFELVKNRRYIEEKILIRDDWVFVTNNWLEYCFGIPV